jgi:hypothetical protein
VERRGRKLAYELRRGGVLRILLGDGGWGENEKLLRSLFFFERGRRKR